MMINKSERSDVIRRIHGKTGGGRSPPLHARM